MIHNRAQLLGVAGGDLRAITRRRRALDLVERALAAIDAQACTSRALEALRERGVLPDSGPVWVLAFGKASLGMARAALAALNPETVRGGIVHALQPASLAGLRVVRAGHPVPAPDAAERGDEVLALARGLGPGDTALCLISGGGSAMLEAPRPPWTIPLIARETRALMEAGADIEALNAARVRMSLVKAGGLARALAPARIINVVLSDVPGAAIDVVASGPTIAADATCVVAGDNRTARQAVLAEASAQGLTTFALPAPFAGEAREVGAQLHAQSIASGAEVAVSGGESTVVVRGDGRGGRNQELVLGAWAGVEEHGGLMLALATDGVDGASDAAGAIVDELVIAQARGLGGEPARALANNDSNRLLSALGATLQTGPTGTNVADIVVHLT